MPDLNDPGETGVDRLLERLCEQFVEDWQAAAAKGSDPPSIESYLAQHPEQSADRLFERLLRIELSLHVPDDEETLHQQYRQRFAKFVDVVDRIFRQDTLPPPTPPPVKPPSTSVRHDVAETEPWQPVAPVERSGDESSTAAAGAAWLGRYEVIRSVGSGNFGVVYLARDRELDRNVAVKVPRSGGSETDMTGDSDWLEAFRAEARKLAALDDPRIVPVYDVGTLQDGRPFIVSRYVAGTTLAVRLRADRMPRAEGAMLIEQIARALHHAHRRGLVHRDVKPANVLIDAQTAMPAVTDFGLAIRQSERWQHQGQVTGTPAYMSPEQCRGDVRNVDGRSDVWALGVMLYEIMTGRRPFDASSRVELLESIEHQSPIPPRQIDDGIPRELERIILKCLEKDPRCRYMTALDLADDLRRWRRNRPALQRRLVLTGAVLVVIAALAASGVSMWSVFWPPAPQPLSGTLDLRRETRVEDGQTPSWSTLGQASTEFAVSGGDLVQVNAWLNRPAFVHILWIEADGNVLPVYPWADLDWNKYPASPPSADEVWCPEGDRGWMVDGPAGVETVVLLARDRPLPTGVDFRQLLAELPALDLPPAPQVRGPRHEPGGPRPMRSIDDRQRRQLLEAHLGDLFPLIHVVSFANLGETRTSHEGTRK